jgi:hypothetical protein
MASGCTSLSPGTPGRNSAPWPRLAGAGEQRAQQRLLARRELHRIWPQVDRAGVPVELQAGRRPGSLRRCGPRAAQQRADAGLQLVQVEGLGQVVVGAGVQAEDAVAHRAAGGEDEHRRARPSARAWCQHLQAVQAGQAQVEQHHVGQAGAPAVQRAPPSAQGSPACRAARSCAAAWPASPGVVFDQQQFHGGECAGPRGWTAGRP